MNIEKNELIVVANESGLETTQAKTILENFTSLFEQAKDWETKAKTIVVTDISQTEQMHEARVARLALKDIRVNAEKLRKDLKEKSLREGKAIDGIANVIKALVVPIEDYLENQEKFAENIEAERKAKVEAERALELSKYVEDVTLYNFKEISPEVFQTLLANVKKAFDARQAEEKAAEEERLAILKKKEEEDEKMRIENARLKKEQEDREKKDAEDRKKLEAEQRRKDEEHQAAIDKAEAEKKKLQKELDDKAEEDRKKKAEEARIAKENEEKERQAKLAPEKDKLIAYAESIRTIQAPTELSKAGLEIVKEVEQKLLAISQDIKIKIKNL